MRIPIAAGSLRSSLSPDLARSRDRFGSGRTYAEKQTSGGAKQCGALQLRGMVNFFDSWWAWVDLNHRPHPYQNCGHRSRAKNLSLPPSFVEPPCASAASQTKSLSRSARFELRRMRNTNRRKIASIAISTTRFATYLVQPATDLVFGHPTVRN